MKIESDLFGDEENRARWKKVCAISNHSKNRMYSKEIEAYKKTLRLSRRQREVLIGLLLGDGHLETQNNGRTYRLKVEQSVKKRAYVRWLYKLFQEFTLQEPREVKNATKHNLCFSTVSHGAFRFYAHLFYGKDSKKSISKQICKFLTDEGLAVWFMDDGSIKSKGCLGRILNTQGFQKEESILLIGALKEKFGIESRLRFQKDGYQIYILAESYKMLIERIGKYVIPSMRYKL